MIRTIQVDRDAQLLILSFCTDKDCKTLTCVSKLARSTISPCIELTAMDLNVQQLCDCLSKLRCIPELRRLKLGLQEGLVPTPTEEKEIEGIVRTLTYPQRLSLVQLGTGMRDIYWFYRDNPQQPRSIIEVQFCDAYRHTQPPSVRNINTDYYYAIPDCVKRISIGDNMHVMPYYLPRDIECISVSVVCNQQLELKWHYPDKHVCLFRRQKGGPIWPLEYVVFNCWHPPEHYGSPRYYSARQRQSYSDFDDLLTRNMHE